MGQSSTIEIEPAAGLQASLKRAREAIYATGTIAPEDGAPRDVASAGVLPDRGEALRRVLLTEKAASCVETGFAFGMSSSFILDALLGAPPNAAIGEAAPKEPLLISMDPWQSMAFGGAGRRHLREAGVSHLHTLFEEDSALVLPRLLAQDRKFNAAFIDGDHRFDGVFVDVFYACRLVGPGRLVIVDDLWMPAVRKCVAFFTSSGICTVETRPEIPTSDKFALLRVLHGGESRKWDHWVEF